MRLLIGISGSSYAPSSMAICDALEEERHNLRVVCTPEAQAFLPRRFIRRAAVDQRWRKPIHIDAVAWAESFLVLPTTANLLAVAAQGLAPNLLATMLVAWQRKVLFFPAMNRSMWTAPATQANVITLQQRGHFVHTPSRRWDSPHGLAFEPIGYSTDDVLAAVRKMGEGCS